MQKQLKINGFAKFGLKSGLVGLLCVSVMACSATFRNHGYTPSDGELENILAGVDTRGTVEEIIGRPSSTGVLHDNAWYYISSKVRSYAYKKPQTVERTLLAISFDDAGVVQNIERFGLEDGRVITFSRRTTAASVKGTSFFRQLISNVGNINPGELLDQG